MTTPHINELRAQLMATLTSLRDRDNPMEPDRARAVAQVAGVLVETAKVEVEFLRVTHGDSSAFLGTNDTPALPNASTTPTPHNPFPTSARHRLHG